jgi:hypothetical protein
MIRKSQSTKLKFSFINPNNHKDFEELLRIIILEKIKNTQKKQLNIQ